MSTVTRPARDPRRPLLPVPLPDRAAQIHAWYLALPAADVDRLVRDVDHLVRDVAPAFTDQANRRSNSTTEFVERAFGSFTTYLADPQSAAAEIGPVFAGVGRQMAVDGLEIDTMQRTLHETSGLIVDRLEHMIDRHPLRASLALHLVAMLTDYLAQLREHVEAGMRSVHPDDPGRPRRDRSMIFRFLRTGVTREAVQAFTDRTGMVVPPRVAAVCVVGAREPLPTLPPLDEVGYLPATGPLTELLLVPEDLPAVETAARGLRPGDRIVVGPTVPATRAVESFAVARAARSHLDSPSLPRTPVLRCDEHLVELLLLSDHVSVASLVERRLAPLAQVPEKDREQYATVLYALLASGKSVRQLARDLHYHQQTLQARVNRLRAAYGPELDDPDVRVEIMLALRHVIGAR